MISVADLKQMKAEAQAEKRRTHDPAEKIRLAEEIDALEAQIRQMQFQPATRGRYGF